MADEQQAASLQAAQNAKSDLISNARVYAQTTVEDAERGVRLQRDFGFLALAKIGFTQEDFNGANAALTPGDVALFIAGIHALDEWMSAEIELTLPDGSKLTIVPGAVLRAFSIGLSSLPTG